jgi:hypothetical protein
LRALGVGFLRLGFLASFWAITLSWVRHGCPGVSGLFHMDGGPNAIALAFAFLTGVILLMMGCWIGRRPSWISKLPSPQPGV